MEIEIIFSGLSSENFSLRYCDKYSVLQKLKESVYVMVNLHLLLVSK
jgi:hypothetical protein